MPCHWNSYYLEKNLNDKAIFLVPEKNSNLIEEFKVFKTEALADDYHDMVIMVTWEEILEKLDIHLKKANDESSLRLLMHYEEFLIKYIFSWMIESARLLLRGSILEGLWEYRMFISIKERSIKKDVNQKTSTYNYCWIWKPK